NDDLTGATLTLRINDTDVLLAQPLDAKGNAAGTFSGITIKARLKNTTGAYSLRLRGADLRSVFGLNNATGTGLDGFTVRLTINGSGLDLPIITAQLEGSYRTTANKSTALRFDFRRNRTLTGAFNCNRTAAAKSSHGERIVTRGVLEAEGSAPVIPTGDLKVHMADGTMIIPLAAMKTTGSVWSYTAPKGAIGVVKLSLNNTTRSFQMAIAEPTIGLPAAAPGGQMKYA